MATANEKLLEKSITDALNLQRLTANERKKITELLVKLASTLRGKFAELPELSSMSETKRRKLIDKYAKDCDKEISAQFASFGKTYTKTLAGIAVFEAARAAKNINTTLEVSLLPEKVLTAEQAQTLISESWVSGKTVSEMLSNSEESFRSAFKEQIRQGYAAGETNDQIIRRIKGYTDKSGLKHNGIAEMSRKSAETMVRTAVMGVANDARWKLYESNSDILQGVMWVATLDERTCPECRARDGKMWDMNRQPVGDNTFPFELPPHHRQCRCTLTCCLKRYGDIKGRKDLAKASPSTRASMDGQVPNSMTFEDWFAQQSDTRQREILGAGRYELYKSGKISFGDLVDQNGRGLTLEEIKERM